MHESQNLNTGVRNDRTGNNSDTAQGPPAPTIDLVPGATAAQPPKPTQVVGERVPGHGPTVELKPDPNNGSDWGCTIEFSGDRSVSGASEPSSLPDATDPSFPAVRGYKILGVLGRGGMGVVYRARDVKLDRIVALKMIIAGAHAGPEQLTRFTTEAQAVAHLRHPNIIQIYEVGERDGLPYVSLEFVDGGSLAQKCAGKPLADAGAARVTEKLAIAMHHAHENGVVHRDLKPANILVTADGEPKITDFGLAKRLEGDSSQTRSGTILGTPSYMAPEQAMGEGNLVGPHTDVYSLGATLYELITGRPPFLAANPMDTVMQVVREEPVPPSRLAPNVARDLETICLKCLHKDPTKRYPSARALAEDLGRFQSGEPITARPVGDAERLWRWCKRNPRLATSYGAVAALVLIGFIGSLVATFVIHRAKVAAVAAQSLAEGNERRAKSEQLRAEQAEHQATANAQLASANAQAASDQAELALDALRTVVSEVDRELRDRSAMSPVRTKLLEMALTKVDQVAAKADGVTALDRIRAAAYQQKVFIYQGLEQPQKAAEQQQLAQAILERLAAANPQGVDADKARGNLGAAIDTLADLIRPRSPDDAKANYLRALEIREELRRNPQSDFYLPHVLDHFVANSLDRLGSVERDLNHLESARDYHLRALEIRRATVAVDPNEVEFQESLAANLASLSAVEQSLGDWDSARKHLDESMTVRQGLADKDPINIRYKLTLATTQSQLGDLTLFLKDFPAAIEQYAAAEKLMRQVVESDGSLRYRRMLPGLYYRLATAELLANRPESSDEHFHKALEVIDGIVASNVQMTLGFKSIWMLVLGRCRNHAEAAKLAEDMSFTEPQPRWLYNSACGFALCHAAVGHRKAPEELTADERSLRDKYQAQALDAIQRAIQKGYRDISELENNPELDSIRSHPGFVEQVAQLKARDGAKP
jgi:tetratricopeptide (TPR) repeat protein